MPHTYVDEHVSWDLLRTPQVGVLTVSDEAPISREVAGALLTQSAAVVFAGLDLSRWFLVSATYAAATTRMAPRNLWKNYEYRFPGVLGKSKNRWEQPVAEMEGRQHVGYWDLHRHDLITAVGLTAASTAVMVWLPAQYDPRLLCYGVGGDVTGKVGKDLYASLLASCASRASAYGGFALNGYMEEEVGVEVWGRGSKVAALYEVIC